MGEKAAVLTVERLRARWREGCGDKAGESQEQVMARLAGYPVGGSEGTRGSRVVREEVAELLGGASFVMDSRTPGSFVSWLERLLEQHSAPHPTLAAFLRRRFELDAVEPAGLDDDEGDCACCAAELVSAPPAAADHKRELSACGTPLPAIPLWPRGSRSLLDRQPASLNFRQVLVPSSPSSSCLRSPSPFRPISRSRLSKSSPAISVPSSSPPQAPSAAAATAAVTPSRKRKCAW